MSGARGERAGRLLVLAAALLFAGARLGGVLPGLDGAEAAARDLRFVLRGLRDPGEGVAILGVDEAAAARFASPAALRAALAGAIVRLAADRPAVIAVDMLLAGPTPADPALAAAFAAGPPVVIAAAALDGPASGDAPALGPSLVPLVRAGVAATPAAPAFVWPEPVFATAARIAHANIAESPDGAARAIPLVLPAPGGGWLPALPLAAAQAATGARLALEPGRAVALGERRLPTDAAHRVTIDHPGPAGTIPTHALGDLLEGRLPPGTFAGRAVFVGATAASLRDEFATPFGPATPGVEVLAAVHRALLSGGFPEVGGRAPALSAAAALVAAAAALLLMRRGGPAAPAFGAAGGIGLGAAALLGGFLAGNLMLDAPAVLGAAAIAVTGGAALSWTRERARARRAAAERDNLSHFVAPRLAALLAQSGRPDFDGREQEVTVLFADLAGSTGLAERLPPAAVAAVLRGLHQHIGDAAVATGASVIDFLGDGAMLVFGLPDPEPGDAAAALACARALLATPFATGEAAVAAGGVRLRVSVHTGPVAVAVLGAAQRRHVTVTGDTVNVAARLQDAAKAHGAALVASRATLDAAGEAAAGFVPLGPADLRGRSRPVEVWALPPGRSAA